MPVTQRCNRLFHKCWGREPSVHPEQEHIHSCSSRALQNYSEQIISQHNLYSSLPVLPMLVEFVLWTVSSWDCTLSSKPFSLFFLHSNSILLLIFTLEISISVVVTFFPFNFLSCSSSSYKRKIQPWDYFSNSAKQQNIHSSPIASWQTSIQHKTFADNFSCWPYLLQFLLLPLLFSYQNWQLLCMLFFKSLSHFFKGQHFSF